MADSNAKVSGQKTAATPAADGPALSVRGLTVEIETRRATVHPVTDLSLDADPGEFLCIVGESGSGKSMTLLALMGLLPAAARIRTGTAFLGGTDLLALSPSSRRKVVGRRISIVFQDPSSTLNPLMRVGAQVAEMITTHQRRQPRSLVWERVIWLFDLVGIPDAGRRVDDYPHQFSGGMRQRVMIAMAIANNPAVLLADEPTTALDVTVQAQVLDTLQRTREALGTTVVMVTHDLGVVAEVADRVAVMYGGRVVETAPVSELFHDTRHPYTAALLACQPRISGPPQLLRPIPGAPPDMTALPLGCAFSPRCRFCDQLCDQQRPALAEFAPRRAVACHHPVHLGGRR